MDDVEPELTEIFQSGQKTAKKAAAILVAKNQGFVVPSAKERANLLVAFAKSGKAVYGRAFDIVRVIRQVNLADLSDVERNLSAVTVYEIKSTRKVFKADFRGHFFSLTGAEILVAQSLKHQFKFILVNTGTGEYLELSLNEIFARARNLRDLEHDALTLLSKNPRRPRASLKILSS